jgi:hypothetical protein
LTRDLGLPAIQASLYFYDDRAAFQQALELDGYEPGFARDAADTLSGIAGFRRVILNDANLRWLEWPNRVALLAHELTHTVQYEFSRGRRSTSEQWLREGFAEWVEVYVMDVLDFTTWNQARAIAVQRVRDAARRQPPPAFVDMVTYPQWVRTVQRSGEAAVYAQALLAADLLIARHGDRLLPPVRDVGRSFGQLPHRVRRGPGGVRNGLSRTPCSDCEVATLVLVRGYSQRRAIVGSTESA